MGIPPRATSDLTVHVAGNLRVWGVRVSVTVPDRLWRDPGAVPGQHRQSRGGHGSPESGEGRSCAGRRRPGLGP